MGFFNPRGLKTLDKPCPDSREWNGSTSPYHLLHVLTDNNLDLCGLGEIHLKKPRDCNLFQRQLDEASDDLQLPHFTILWGCAASHGSGVAESHSGVAVVVRTDLLEGGDLEIIDAAVERHRDGRLMVLDFSWKGHVVRLCTVYLPSAECRLQHDFVDSRLEFVMASARLAQVPVILMGDFNFVDNWRLDRTCSRVAEEEKAKGRGQAKPPTNWLDEARWPAKRMKALCELYGLVDVFRELHHGRRGFTFFSANSAARLDRIYISEGLFSHCMGSSRVPLARKSDHLPVMMELRALIETCPGKKPPKARLGFLQSEGLRAEWERWMVEEEKLMQGEEGQVLQALHARLKQRMVRKTMQLNQAHKHEQGPSSTEGSAARSFEEAMGEVEAEATGEALHALMECRRNFTNALAQEDLQREMQRRFKWVRQGEKPSPWLTQSLSRSRWSPIAKRSISALRLSNGLLTRDGPLMAAAVMEYWKSISAAPAVTDERRDAQKEVLDSVRKCVSERASQISEEQANLAGDPVISMDTVKRVGAEIDGGKAPGPDGIPFLLWMKSMPIIAGHLARVFTSIGETGTVPKGFLDGMLKSLFKGSARIVPPLDPTDVQNYRPITLLNTDYRLLGRILSSRATSILSSCIPSSHTAFLPGRLMGDNILLLQLLPSVLKLNSRESPLASSGVIAFLDFKKAYDTVDRSFLLQLMGAFGFGEGMIKWYRTLLTETYTAASVNGHVSASALLDGGIRQGGCESCGGYLPVPAALECVLSTCEVVGLKVTADGMLYGDYFADDGHILLRSLDPSDIALFKAKMHTFALATNQHLNLSKTKLLPIGQVPRHLPSSVEGLSIVSSATSLGIDFTNDITPPSDEAWTELITKAEEKYQLISNLHLSPFGRSLAAGTYGTSKLFHACEFSGPLPPSISASHDKAIRHLVDLDLAPSSLLQNSEVKKKSTMPGIHTQALVGSPAEGGFGVNPLEEHSQARWFMQAHRYILWTLGDPKASFQPKPVARLHFRMEQAKKKKMEYLLTTEEKLLLMIQPVRPLWIDLVTALLTKANPAFHPVETLLTACHCTPGDAAKGRLPSGILPPGPLRRWCIAFAALGPPLQNDALRSLSTILRLDPAATPAHRFAGSLALIADIRARYWRPFGRGQRLRLLDGLATVKSVTRALLAPKIEWQRTRRLEQLNHSLSLVPSPPASPDLEEEYLAVGKRMAALWKLRECPNKWKDIAWRIQYNGVRAAGGHDIPQACSCGWAEGQGIGRGSSEDKRIKALACKAHVFGGCPVAQAVIHVLRAGLPSCLAPLLQPSDVWLLRLPPSTIEHSMHEGVWSLVCSLALHAINSGHSSLYVLSHQSPPLSRSDAVSRASNKAVGWFSYLLADVAAAGFIPKEWKDLSTSHPFLHSMPSPDGVIFPARRLAARLPAALAVLPSEL